MIRFISDQMSFECKESLIDSLNWSIKLNTPNLSEEFKKILGKNLPIFTLFTEHKEDKARINTVTALECEYFMVPNLVLQSNLPIDSSLKLIDLSQNESKSSLIEFLQLKEYPFETLLAKSFEFYTKNNAYEKCKQLIRWTLKNDYCQKVDLFSKRTFRNKANSGWMCLSEIYDCESKLVKEFVPEELHLSTYLASEQAIYVHLKPFLSTTVDSKHFEKYLSKHFSTKVCQAKKDYKARFSMILELLASLSAFEKTRQVTFILFSISFHKDF